MKTIIFILFASAALLAGCNHQHGNDQNHATHDSHENESGSLHLNNGTKWKINPEMIPHITASDKLLADFQVASGDHKVLAEKLKENNDKLIASCTMKGEAHDQLHVWLLPHVKLVNELSDAESEDDAEHIIAEIKESRETFDRYFQ